MLLGLALVAVALLWARKLRHGPGARDASLLGPWIMGLGGVAVFLFYLWLITQGARGL